MTDFEQKLKPIYEKCLHCEKCSLCKSRTNIVFSAGVPNSKLMLIGEAPGYYEDMEGEPFVGKAGQLLDKILGCVGFSRKENIYICNTLKCRPPQNRDPLPEEKAACKEYLDKQIEILKPRIILLCGKVAAYSFIDTKSGITKLRGKWYEGPYFSKMMPIFHPSYLLRNDSREKGSPKWLMWQDIKEVRRVYDQMR
ncbi:MAG: uracil-DNA glycosylase [Cyanobacteriota bacterium]|nr:uracil-DNA glycosylase [Cyanobacteriota bacterium]MDY6359273.1 uracil-DNA glycosylase [Cyanobacteriota bacterium]MDY6364532.1 uracil-DNA glycosylase [Cyanobacteriota bacterium]MDY6383469.1 uracil-DNA glycosylase [Cyanobacteriota bacterium]